MLSKLGMMQSNPTDDESLTTNKINKYLQYGLKAAETWPTKIMQYIWKEIPPSGSLMANFEIGYWPDRSATESAPFETLFLGNNEEDLCKLKGIAVDGLFGGMEAWFSDGTRKSIGPRLEGMKEFSINGAGGERIVSAYIGVSKLPQFLRIQTNHARQFVVGQPDSVNSPQRMPPELPERLLAAFCIGWGYGKERRSAAPHALTILSTVRHQFDDLPGDIVDEQERYWEPCSPPKDWVPSASIFPIPGQNVAEITPLGRAFLPVPSSRLVSWLDCSKPLTKVEIWLCHPMGGPLGEQLQ